MTESVLSRFLRYVKIDTESAEGVDAIPSTPKQFDLARLLVDEMKAIGIADARVDEHCYVYGTVPASLPPEEAAKVPVLGLIAHLDTSPSMSGRNVKPIVHTKYGGGDLPLSGVPGKMLLAAENPRLAHEIGNDIVTSDGTTLLGADDKAGIAAIMTVAAELIAAGARVPHGAIKIGFTPDEEVGRGAEKFDVAGFGAKYAYTVDGEEPGEVNAETFNAASVTAIFRGRNVHPGFAKGIMVNSLYAASRFISLFPPDARPETTEKREGYLHPHELKGAEEETTLKILLRDFEHDQLEVKRHTLESMREQVQHEFPGVSIELQYKESYRNMGEIIAKHPQVMTGAEEAMQRAGIPVVRKAIRGGTDGARLSFMGLPCANLFAGTENAHSASEWVSVASLEKSVRVLTHLVQIWAEKGGA